MSLRTTEEVFVLSKREEISVSLRKGLVLWLCGIFKRYLHRGQKNQIVKQWPESYSVQDILIFFEFAKFCWCFIPRFSQIAPLLTLMPKASSTQSTESRKDVVRVSVSRKHYNDKVKPVSKHEIEANEVDSYKIDD